MTLSAILCFIALTLVSEALFIPRPPVDWTRSAVTKQINTLTKFSSLAVIGAAQRAHAAQGAIKPSTIEETKMAVKAIQEVLDSVQSVDGLVEKKDFDVVAAMFATKAFSEFANNCQTLVRSDAISADDKVNGRYQTSNNSCLSCHEAPLTRPFPNSSLNLLRKIDWKIHSEKGGPRHH